MILKIVVSTFLISFTLSAFFSPLPEIPLWAYAVGASALMLFFFILALRKELKLYEQGKFDELIDLYNKRLQNIKFQQSHQIYKSEIACLQGWKGELANARETLKDVKLDELNSASRSNYYLTLALIDLYENHNPVEATVHITEALKHRYCADYYLMLSHLYDLSGQTEEAEKAIASFFNPEKKSSLLELCTDMIFGSKKLDQAYRGYWLGLYYDKRGDKKLAQEHFSSSSSVPFPNFYSSKSQNFKKTA